MAFFSYAFSGVLMSCFRSLVLYVFLYMVISYLLFISFVRGFFSWFVMYVCMY